MSSDRLFTAIMPGGIVYCDKRSEEHGDYLKVAFLPYDTLDLRIYRPDSPLVPGIVADAALIVARRGQQFRVSSCGQTVLLGERHAR